LVIVGVLMRVQSKIQKWGNGLAIRIAGIMRDVPHFQEGTPIEVEVFEDRLEIRKLRSAKHVKLPFSEAALLEEITPETVHADLIAKPLEGEY